jgi:hypothetical protein
MRSSPAGPGGRSQGTRTRRRAGRAGECCFARQAAAARDCSECPSCLRRLPLGTVRLSASGSGRTSPTAVPRPGSRHPAPGAEHGRDALGRCKRRDRGQTRPLTADSLPLARLGARRPPRGGRRPSRPARPESAQRRTATLRTQPASGMTVHANQIPALQVSSRAGTRAASGSRCRMRPSRGSAPCRPGD